MIRSMPASRRDSLFMILVPCSPRDGRRPTESWRHRRFTLAFLEFVSPLPQMHCRVGSPRPPCFGASFKFALVEQRGTTQQTNITCRRREMPYERSSQLTAAYTQAAGEYIYSFTFHSAFAN